jgi:hypothetical protein
LLEKEPPGRNWNEEFQNMLSSESNKGKLTPETIEKLGVFSKTFIETAQRVGKIIIEEVKTAPENKSV